MIHSNQSRLTSTTEAETATHAGDPCIAVIFGASGDLTKRLLMPAIYNLACDRLLPDEFAIVGMAMDDLTTDVFRQRLSQDIRQFCTHKEFDSAVWERLASRLYYTPGKFDDPVAYKNLADLIQQLNEQYRASDNILFYMATPPSVFGLVSRNLHQAGLARCDRAWRRIVVEKPFGADLASAIELNRELLEYWNEDQIYRIDHYLGKETVQNLLAFRFSNGIFEHLWNSKYIDHIQFTVAETVGVEGRGNYYERSGVLRDMVQNHMLQMLAYLCMEPPNSFRPDAIRNEKAKVLESVRIMGLDDVRRDTVRGQYGSGRSANGSAMPAYRDEASVDPRSRTETFAAMKLHIDNWRWSGVPIYLRSGKRLWKRQTEIMVQFKKAPEVLFRGTPAAEQVGSNQLIFHIQPDQAIEFRFQAKTPGPSMQLQPVNMRFNYSEAFEASRGTGYEVMIYHSMTGDTTLFSRTDLVEAAWRIAQPLLDGWTKEASDDFPNYPAGSWGPKAAFDLIERDGRHWLEIINRNVLEKVPLFQDCSPVFLNSLAMMLRPGVCSAGDYIIRKGEIGSQMYFVNRGEFEVLGEAERVLATLSDGNFFGEVALLLSQPRNASVRAKTDSGVFILDRTDFAKVLRDHPQFANSIREAAKSRYDVTLTAAESAP